MNQLCRCLQDLDSLRKLQQYILWLKAPFPAVRVWRRRKDIFTTPDLMNKLINQSMNKAVFRTAPATLGQLIILHKICPIAAGLAQQGWNKQVLAKERVLSVCQSVCLSVCMSLCLSVCLSVRLSFCLSVCPRSSAQLATRRRTCSFRPSKCLNYHNKRLCEIFLAGLNLLIQPYCVLS